MERVRITKACDALDRPHPTGRKLYRFEPGTVLRLLREDEPEFYKVVYLGMLVFVPKGCAVGATKDEPLIEILGTTKAGEGAGATAPSSSGASRHTVDSDAPTDTAVSESPDAAPPPTPKARAEEAPVHPARPPSQPAAFVVPRWLRWLASQRVAAQERRTLDSENLLDAASAAAPVSSIPAPTSDSTPAPEMGGATDAIGPPTDLLGGRPVSGGRLMEVVSSLATKFEERLRRMQDSGYLPASIFIDYKLATSASLHSRLEQALIMAADDSGLWAFPEVRVPLKEPFQAPSKNGKQRQLTVDVGFYKDGELIGIGEVNTLDMVHTADPEMHDKYPKMTQLAQERPDLFCFLAVVLPTNPPEKPRYKWVFKGDDPIGKLVRQWLDIVREFKRVGAPVVAIRILEDGTAKPLGT